MRNWPGLRVARHPLQHDNAQIKTFGHFCCPNAVNDGLEGTMAQRRLINTLLAAGLLTLPGLPADAQDKGIVGTWKMVSATLIENGKTSDYFGPNPLGQIIFTANGHFSNLLVRSDVPKVAANSRVKGTDEENAAMVHGDIGYYGTWTLNGDQLKMHIIGSTYPNWVGQDQTRTVHVSGNQIVWENSSASAGGSSKQIYQREE